MVDYRQFEVSGTHADLGHVLASVDGPFARQPWWAPSPDAPFAHSCLAVLQEVHPALVDEHRAYADAQTIPFDAFWRDCCRVDLRARMTHRYAHMAGSAEGCSSVAVRALGGWVVGRNYDYWRHQVRRQRVIFRGAQTFAHAGARGSVPCGRYDGMNQRGLFFSLHVVLTEPTRPEEVKPGIPFHLMGRLVLERCSTLVDAVELLTSIPHLSSLNYLVADETGACVIEADPRRVRVRPAENGRLAATNHFRHADMAVLQGARQRTPCRRHAHLQQASGEMQGMRFEESQTAMARLLSDRTAPVCGLDGALQTLWSCIAVPALRKLTYSPGAPVATAYHEVPVS